MTQQIHYANSFKYQPPKKPDPRNSCKPSPPNSELSLFSKQVAIPYLIANKKAMEKWKLEREEGYQPHWVTH